MSRRTLNTAWFDPVFLLSRVVYDVCTKTGCFSYSKEECRPGIRGILSGILFTNSRFSATLYSKKSRVCIPQVILAAGDEVGSPLGSRRVRLCVLAL